MKLFDVNILIYAHRQDQDYHEFYRDRLESMINGSDAFGLSTLVAAAFLRIVTHRRFPNGPTPLSQAISVVESISNLSNCYWINPGAQHWQLLSELCRLSQCTGKHVSDAQHAAVAIENACIWVTRDEDFSSFTRHGLRLQLSKP
jgi:hypothetical protein